MKEVVKEAVAEVIDAMAKVVKAVANDLIDKEMKDENATTSKED